MQIENIFDLQAAVDMGSFTIPGGYPIYFVCHDGGVLSPQAVKDNLALVVEAVACKDEHDWRVVGVEVNYEDPALYCDHTGERIPSAYAED